MRYVAAYLLAALSKDAPSKADVTKILESVGLDIDDERLDKVVFPNYIYNFGRDQITIIYCVILL